MYNCELMKQNLGRLYLDNIIPILLLNVQDVSQTFNKQIARVTTSVAWGKTLHM